jgi:hypothetical protein
MSNIALFASLDPGSEVSQANFPETLLDLVRALKFLYEHEIVYVNVHLEHIDVKEN